MSDGSAEARVVTSPGEVGEVLGGLPGCLADDRLPVEAAVREDGPESGLPDLSLPEVPVTVAVAPAGVAGVVRVDGVHAVPTHVGLDGVDPRARTGRVGQRGSGREGMARIEADADPIVRDDFEQLTELLRRRRDRACPSRRRLHEDAGVRDELQGREECRGRPIDCVATRMCPVSSRVDDDDTCEPDGALRGVRERTDGLRVDVRVGGGEVHEVRRVQEDGEDVLLGEGVAEGFVVARRDRGQPPPSRVGREDLDRLASAFDGTVDGLPGPAGDRHVDTETHHRGILARLAWVLASLALVSSCGPAPEALDVASGTILVDTGFADAFARELKQGADVLLAIRATGSGEAFALARRGEVDLLFVHEPAGLRELARSGRVAASEAFLRARWVIAGPPRDPAGVEGARSFAEAFSRIARTGSPFVSRGDGSGTHARELATWEDAGVEPDSQWYGRTGRGQAETLSVAAERGAYALTDEATVRTTRTLARLGVWTIADPEAWTTYEAVALRGPASDAAERVVQFTTSPRIRELVSGFGADRYDEPLFSIPGR